MPSPIEISRQQLAAHSATSIHGVEVMAPLSGMRDHQRVLATDTLSQITEAAEEIGMAVAHRADRHTLRMRKIKMGQSVNLSSLARIAEFYDKLPNMPQREKLQQLISRMQGYQRILESGSGKQPTKQDVLAALQEFDRDITHQYAALSLVRDFFRAQPRRRSSAAGSDRLESLLEEAAAEFETTERMRDVNAGFAAAGLASTRAPQLATDPGEIRDSYRALLRESRHYGELFDQLGKYSMGRQFDEVVDTFIEIAGIDMSSVGPSTDPRFLAMLLAELGKLKKLKTVHECMGDMIRDLGRGNPGGSSVLEVDPRTSLLLHFCCRPMTTLADARRLVSGLEKAGPLVPLVFANGLFNLHQQIPDEVMPTTGAKLKQNTVLRSLLDSLVAEEEQAYQSEMESQQPQ